MPLSSQQLQTLKESIRDDIDIIIQAKISLDLATRTTQKSFKQSVFQLLEKVTRPVETSIEDIIDNASQLEQHIHESKDIPPQTYARLLSVFEKIRAHEPVENYEKFLYEKLNPNFNLFRICDLGLTAFELLTENFDAEAKFSFTNLRLAYLGMTRYQSENVNGVTTRKLIGSSPYETEGLDFTPHAEEIAELIKLEIAKTNVLINICDGLLKQDLESALTDLQLLVQEEKFAHDDTIDAKQYLLSFFIAENITHSTHLHLAKKQLTANSLNALFSYPNLLKNIHHLDLHANQFGDAGALEVATFIENSNLKTLNLSDNQLTAVSIFNLAPMLAKNTSITQIDVSWNPVSDNGALTLADFLRERVGSPLTLNLSNCNISDIGAEHLLELLKSNPLIIGMNLSENLLSRFAHANIINAVQMNADKYDRKLIASVFPKNVANSLLHNLFQPAVTHAEQNNVNSEVSSTFKNN